MRLIPNVNTKNCSKCPVCVKVKFFKKSFKSITIRKTDLLKFVHSDLAGSKNTMSKGVKKWYITFVDDYSRYTKVYLLKSKDKVEEMFLKYKAEVENQLDRKIKRLRSDRGGEYDINSLTVFCEKNGIIHETSAPYTPKQNGVIERKNCTLKDMMNAMLISFGLFDNIWWEVVFTACFILNRVPYKKLDLTPYVSWKGYVPNLNFLKVWGCLAKIALPSHKYLNIGPKTFDAVFIGYAQNSVAHRFMSLSNFSISEYRDAEFLKHVFPLKNMCLMLCLMSCLNM